MTLTGAYEPSSLLDIYIIASKRKAPNKTHNIPHQTPSGKDKPTPDCIYTHAHGSPFFTFPVLLPPIKISSPLLGLALSRLVAQPLAAAGLDLAQIIDRFLEQFKVLGRVRGRRRLAWLRVIVLLGNIQLVDLVIVLRLVGALGQEPANGEVEDGEREADNGRVLERGAVDLVGL